MIDVASKALEEHLSFTPAFRPVTELEEIGGTVLTVCSFPKQPRLLKGQDVTTAARKPLKRLIDFLRGMITGLKPGVN